MQFSYSLLQRDEIGEHLFGFSAGTFQEENEAEDVIAHTAPRDVVQLLLSAPGQVYRKLLVFLK